MNLAGRNIGESRATERKAPPVDGRQTVARLNPAEEEGFEPSIRFHVAI
jgi:hypothetical protein